MDDVVTRSITSAAEHRLQVLAFLRICVIERIPLQLRKAHLLCKYVRFLGMINGNGLVIPCPNKVIAVVTMTRPIDVATLQSFLGSVGWFRRHISDHAEKQSPLNSLTVKGAEWKWTEQHEHAWLQLKRALMSFPVLRTYDPSLETLLYTDASKLHIGGALCQKMVNEDGTTDLVVIAFYSRSLRGPELSYPIQQQEMLAIVACCQAFERYLLLAKFTVRACTDHRSLTNSHKGLTKVACDRITRWCQKIAIYDLVLEYMPGCQMDLPDLLSRSLQQPDDAWKSMDVIDASDFVYAPLLALEPQYLAYARLYLHSADGSDEADVNTNEDDADSYYWRPHEEAFMSITIPPATTKVFCASDYLGCSEFSQLYAALLVQNGLRSQEAIDSDIKSAKEILRIRYDELKLQLPPIKSIAPKQLEIRLQQYEIVGGLFYFRSSKHGMLLCVPNIYNASGHHLRQLIFDEMHKVPHRGHRGVTATKSAMRVRFHWSTMMKDVVLMHKACHECQVSKINRQKPVGQLQPVQTPLQIAQSYNIDLLGPFPESKNGNHKLHISVDRFSRRIWLIPVPITITSAQLAEKFVNEVLLKGGRGIPLSLVSDNDTLFTAKYWETMFKHFGTKLCFSTARTQSTNGLAERYVAVVEEILRTRINYSQDDWEELIPHLLFAVNNQDKDTLTGMSPMQVELGITPITPVDLIDQVSRAKAQARHPTATKATDVKSAAQQRIEQMSDLRDSILNHIETVKQQMKQYADERRRAVDAFLKVGAKAYVNMPAAQLKQHGLRPSRKLNATCFGPFDVIERVSANAFKLDLGVSVSSKTIDVFHVKYLRPTIDGPYRPSVTLQPLPVTEDDDEPEYEIDRILDRKRCRGKFEYLVQYKGYPLLKDCQWRPHDELSVTAPIILEEFTAQFSKEPAVNILNKRKRNTVQNQSS